MFISIEYYVNPDTNEKEQTAVTFTPELTDSKGLHHRDIANAVLSSMKCWSVVSQGRKGIATALRKGEDAVQKITEAQIHITAEIDRLVQLKEDIEKISGVGSKPTELEF